MAHSRRGGVCCYAPRPPSPSTPHCFTPRATPAHGRATAFALALPGTDANGVGHAWGRGGLLGAHFLEMAVGHGSVRRLRRGWLLAVAGNSVAHYTGWVVERMPAAALSAKLSPYYRVLKPQGAGPFPTALLHSGCDGPKDNLDRWAAALNADGWAAVIVDGHTPRGLADHEMWRLVCAGQVFMGSERAGDVLVSLDDVRRMPFVDPDRIALRRLARRLGDHGPAGAGPAGPPAVQPRLPAGRCGDRPAARAHRDAPALPLLRTRQPGPARWLAPAGPDAVPAQRRRRDRRFRPLRHIAAAMRDRDQPVSWELFEGVTHGFDQQDKAPFSALEYNPEATAAAIRRGVAFLNSAAGR